MLAFLREVMGVIYCKVCTLVIYLKENSGQLGVDYYSLWEMIIVVQ
jgi:transcription elongation factor Elf1